MIQVLFITASGSKRKRVFNSQALYNQWKNSTPVFIVKVNNIEVKVTLSRKNSIESEDKKV